MEGMTPTEGLFEEKNKFAASEPLFKTTQVEEEALATMQEMYQEPVTEMDSYHAMQEMFSEPQTEQRSMEKTAIAYKRAEKLGPCMAGNVIGEPIMATAQAKKTEKQKKDDTKRLKKLQAKYADADLATLDMYEQTSKQQKQEQAMLAAYQAEKEKHPLEQDAHADTGVLMAFCHRCDLDKKNKPVTKEAKNLYKQNIQFMKDYDSGNAELRKPHLDRMLDEVLSINITKEMTYEDYIYSHAAHVREILVKTTYFQKVMKDPLNKAYFEGLPQWQKELLQLKMNPTLISSFHMAVTTVMRMKGVRMSSSDVVLADNAYMNSLQGRTMSMSMNTYRLAVSKQSTLLLLKRFALLDRYGDAQTRKEVLEREFKKFNAYLDQDGIDSLLQFQQEEEENKNSVTDEWRERLHDASEDHRIFLAYATGHQVDENGEPTNDVMAQRKMEDEQLMERYISKDFNQKASAIEEMMNDALTLEITEEMFTEDYVRKHMTQMFRIGQKMLMTFNIMNGKNNAFYFQNMTKEQRDHILSITYDIQAGLNRLMLLVGAKMGINPQQKDIRLGKDAEQAIELNQEGVEMMLPDALAALRKRNAIPVENRRLPHLTF